MVTEASGSKVFATVQSCFFVRALGGKDEGVAIGQRAGDG